MDHSTRTPQRSTYRSDIDGLRGIAVLAVVAYHLDAARLPGGFVGVDVFFVISGYLITGIVSRDIDRGSFTFRSFYERRARRILPALFTMLLVVCGIALYLLLPQDLIAYSSSLQAAVFSYSNFFFWHTGSYFAATYTWLLLHTWSLSVEEQFYVAFPVTLLLLKRRPRSVLPVLFTIFCASLAYSSWLAFHNATAAFYSPVSRAWELMTGGLLALVNVRPPRTKLSSQTTSIVGLAMVCAPIFLYSKLTVFPGYSALIPCLGAALLIAVGEQERTLASRLLSWKPLVWTGTISYSLYLWHWPLIVASRFEVLPWIKAHGAGKVVLLLLSFAFAYGSWRFVEQPFRVHSGRTSGRSWILGGALAGAMCLLAVSFAFRAGHGFPARFSPRALEVASWMNKPQELTEHNVVTIKRTISSWQVEDHSAIDPNRQNYLLIGDSHAAALRPGLAEQLKGVQIQMMVQPNCEPLIAAKESSACDEMSRYIYEKLLATRHYDAVLLTHRWTTESEINNLEPTVAWFKQQHIPLILIGPVEEYRAPLPLLLAYSIRTNRPQLARENLDPKYGDLDKLLQARAATWQVPYISALQTLCSKTECREYMDSDRLVPTFYDTGHVTYPTANWLAQQWLSKGLLTPSPNQASTTVLRKAERNAL